MMISLQRNNRVIEDLGSSDGKGQGMNEAVDSLGWQH